MDQPLQPLVFEGRVRCPWCKEWLPEEAIVELQTPPDYAKQCNTVLKHGGEDGCKKVFSIKGYDRPAKAVRR